MKKYTVLLLCLAACSSLFAQAPEKKELSSAVKRATANATSSCSSEKCFKDAVYNKNFKRVANTLNRDLNRKNDNYKFVNLTVDLNGQEVTVLEYLVATNQPQAARALYDLYFPYARKFAADYPDDMADNLLEKLVFVTDYKGRMALARHILSQPTVSGVSNRTLKYAVSNSKSVQGYLYLKLLAAERVNWGITTHERDRYSYRMPYVFSSDMRDVDDVLANELKFERGTEEVKWLKHTQRFIKDSYPLFH